MNGLFFNLPQCLTGAEEVRYRVRFLLRNRGGRERIKELLVLASSGAGDQDNASFTAAVVNSDGAALFTQIPKWVIRGGIWRRCRPAGFHV